LRPGGAVRVEVQVEAVVVVLWLHAFEDALKPAATVSGGGGGG
jgi:hypothetical protein